MTVYTPDEVAALLRVPRSRVLELIRGGAIEVVVLGPRTKRIRAEALDRYLDGRIVASREEAPRESQRIRQRLRDHGPKARLARHRDGRVDARRPSGPPVPLRRVEG